MTHNSRKNNSYKNYDETTQIKTGYEVIGRYFNMCKYVMQI